MRLDITLSLFWISLAISAAAVVVFLWLMRDRAGSGRREAGGDPNRSKSDSAS